MLALAPLEILLAIIVFYVVFKLFVRLLNSKKLSKTIDEVTHPRPDSDDEIIAELDHRREAAQRRIGENTADIRKKAEANKKLRRKS